MLTGTSKTLLLGSCNFSHPSTRFWRESGTRQLLIISLPVHQSLEDLITTLSLPGDVLNPQTGRESWQKGMSRLPSPWLDEPHSGGRWNYWQGLMLQQSCMVLVMLATDIIDCKQKCLSGQLEAWLVICMSSREWKVVCTDKIVHAKEYHEFKSSCPVQLDVLCPSDEMER